MSILLRKLIFSSLAALVFLFSLTPYLTVKAQAPTPAPPGTWYNASFTEWFGRVYDEDTSPSSEIFGERYTAAQVQWVFYSLVALVINTAGPEGTKAVACVMAKGAGSCGTEIIKALDSVKLTDTQGSTLAEAFSLNQMSGVGYVKQKIGNFHLIPEVKAQGVGFTAANPIQKLWSAIRNLTFGLIVLVVIVMAFMIMFRVKISPQAVITVQSAIPKVIIALILITFSYAIAGFAIDLMYVVIGFLSAFLSSSEISTYKAVELFNYINSTSVLSLMGNYLTYFVIGVGIALTSVGGVLGAIVSPIFMIITWVVLAIVLIFSVFKILWLLLKTFVNILLQIAFAPIFILLGVISSSGGFGVWLKNLAAELAVFPTVSFLFVMSFFFLAQTYGELQKIPLIGSWLTEAVLGGFPFKINPAILGGQSSWAPPMTFGADGLPLLWLGASFAILALIPKTADIIKGLISGKPFAYGTAIGEAAGAPGRAALGAAGLLHSGSQAYTNLQNAGLLPKKPADTGQIQTNDAARQSVGRARARGGGRMPQTAL